MMVQIEIAKRRAAITVALATVVGLGLYFFVRRKS